MQMDAVCKNKFVLIYFSWVSTSDSKWIFSVYTCTNILLYKVINFLVKSTHFVLLLCVAKFKILYVEQ